MQPNVFRFVSSVEKGDLEARARALEPWHVNICTTYKECHAGELLSSSGLAEVAQVALSLKIYCKHCPLQASEPAAFFCTAFCIDIGVAS